MTSGCLGLRGWSLEPHVCHFVLSRVGVTRTRVWIGNWIYRIQITNNYNTVADLRNSQSLHTNLLSLSALVLTDL
jgi:hypothetical protein